MGGILRFKIGKMIIREEPIKLGQYLRGEKEEYEPISYLVVNKKTMTLKK